MKKFLLASLVLTIVLVMSLPITVFGAKAMFTSKINLNMGDNKYGVLGNATREQALLISERSAEKLAK